MPTARHGFLILIHQLFLPDNSEYTVPYSGICQKSVESMLKAVYFSIGTNEVILTDKRIKYSYTLTAMLKSSGNQADGSYLRPTRITMFVFVPKNVLQSHYRDSQ